MGTLPPAIANFSADKLPYARTIELSMTAPTIGGYVSVEEVINDQQGQGWYGPCPMIKIPYFPPFVDTYIVSGSGFGEYENIDDPAFNPLLEPPWDGPQRIQCWNKVTYDYSTNNSTTGISGTGPRLYKNESDGQIVVSAPEDRPVPYVTWLQLGLSMVADYESLTPNNPASLGFFTKDASISLNIGFNYITAPSVGLIRHGLAADNMNYRLLSVQELQLDSFALNFPIGGAVTFPNGDFEGYYPHWYKQYVNIFAFDVVPPNETFVIQSGWSSLGPNDFVITSVPRYQTYFSSGTYGTIPGSNDPDYVQWDTGINRFGVMTF